MQEMWYNINMKKCEIISEVLCIAHYSNNIELSEQVFNALCEKFGTYSFSWYFVSPKLIKYFDGEWHYHKYNPSFIKGWGTF